MVDLTPLKEAYELEVDPNKKQLLKIAIDLFTTGCKDGFYDMWKEGEHHRRMSPLGAAALDKVMEGFEEEKKQGVHIVLALPAKEKEEGSSNRKRASNSASNRKGKKLTTPLVRRSARLYGRSRLSGKGVKIREPEEEKEDKEVIEISSDED